MIHIVYTVECVDLRRELEWLQEQKIYPSYEEYYDWLKGRVLARIAVIVSPEAALSVKLRHRLDLQKSYRQK